MRRRQFIQTLAGTMACGLAGALATHAAAPVARLERQSEKAPVYLDEIDPNYRRFRQRLREVFEDGHDVLRWELHAPRGGFRFVRATASRSA
jgi:hypothetical protein